MEEVHAPSQEESNFKSKVDELAITMAKLAKCRVELFMEERMTNVQTHPIPLESLEEKKTPRATSYTQLEIELQQPLLEKGMSIQELMAKHMKKGKNMVECPLKDNMRACHLILRYLKRKKT